MTDDRPPNPSTPASNDAALEELVRRYLPVVYAAARQQLRPVAVPARASETGPVEMI